MKALITELLSILPEERCAALSTGKCGCNPRWRICHGEFHEGCHLPRVVHLSRCDGQRSEADFARTGAVVPIMVVFLTPSAASSRWASSAYSWALSFRR